MFCMNLNLLEFCVSRRHRKRKVTKKFNIHILIREGMLLVGVANEHVGNNSKDGGINSIVLLKLIGWDEYRYSEVFQSSYTASRSQWYWYLRVCKSQSQREVSSMCWRSKPINKALQNAKRTQTFPTPTEPRLSDKIGTVLLLKEKISNCIN